MRPDNRSPYPSNANELIPRDWDTFRSRKVFVRRVTTGGRAAAPVAVDTMARERLEQAARRDHIGQPTAVMPRLSGQAVVGDIVRFQDRLWRVIRACHKCSAHGWTVLAPERTVDDDGPLPGLYHSVSKCVCDARPVTERVEPARVSIAPLVPGAKSNEPASMYVTTALEG